MNAAPPTDVIPRIDSEKSGKKVILINSTILQNSETCKLTKLHAWPNCELYYGTIQQKIKTTQKLAWKYTKEDRCYSDKLSVYWK